MNKNNYSSDEILDMLNVNNPAEVQRKGIKLAKNIADLTILCLPIGKKDLWQNCALVLSQKNDEELITISKELLEWISDFNYPGAFIIYERLKKISAHFELYRKNIENAYINAETDFDKECLLNLYSKNKYNVLNVSKNAIPKKIHFICYESKENDNFLVYLTIHYFDDNLQKKKYTIMTHCKSNISNKQIKKYSIEIFDENDILFFVKNEYGCKMKICDVLYHPISFELDNPLSYKNNYTVQITLDSNKYIVKIHNYEDKIFDLNN